jgi:hypothetical protein
VTSNRSTRVVVAVVAVVSLLAGGASPTTAAHPGANGRLVVACDDGLWTLAPDGGDWQHLVGQPATDPAWSPGGTSIVFSRRVSTDTVSLYSVPAGGGVPTRLTRAAGTDLDPEWSPDGAAIVHSSDTTWDGSGATRLWRLDPRAGTRRPMLAVADAALLDPTWSDRGTVAFRLVRSAASAGIHFMIAGSSGYIDPVVEPPAGAFDAAPDWAPDESRFVFVRTASGVRSVWSAAVNGTDLVRMTDADLDVLSPRFSPDGSVIAFLGRPAADAGTTQPYDLWTMNAADGGERVLLASDIDCHHLAWQPLPSFPLVDARFSIFDPAIRWAFAQGITGGCSPERFCPLEPLSRAEMASFVARAFALPPATADHFDDDEASPHEEDVNRIQESGITLGCGPRRFCPDDTLTREQMASILARALDLPPSTSDRFVDDDGSIHEEDINRLADAGLTTGCSATAFCGSADIRRGEMIAFLHRALAP